MARPKGKFPLTLTALLLLGCASIFGVRYYNEPVRSAHRALNRQNVTADINGAVDAAKSNFQSVLQLLSTVGVDLGETAESGETPLIAAVKRRSTDAVGVLLTEPAVLAKLDATDAEASWTALGHALNERNYELASELLAAGASPTVELVPGMPLLIEALQSRDQKLFDYLLKAGADPDAASHDGQTCLALALEMQSGELLAQLADAGVDASTESPRGEPLIIEQVRLGYHDQVAALLDAGADPNIQTESGATSLMTSIQLGDSAMCDLLLDRGADASLGDRNGRTPLALAIAEGRKHFVDRLIRNDARVGDPALLHAAYQTGNLKIVESLLKAGAPVDARDKGKVRLLEVAIKAGDMEAADLLLSHGANCEGMLWSSLRSGNDELLDLVIKNGSDVREKDTDGTAPIGYALANDRAGAAAILLSHGAEADVAHPDGGTWLAHTIVAGKGEMAKALLEHGAKYNGEPAPDGLSLVAWAIANENGEVAELLIKAGADVNETLPSPASEAFREKFGSRTFKYHLQKDRGVTLLMVAAAKKDHVAARALVRAGAKASAYTKRKTLWPVNIAAWFGDVEMMRIMLGKTEKDGRKIVVDLSSQKATLYEDGVVRFTTRVSTGKKGYSTPPGHYVVTNKHRSWNSTIYGSSMPYFLRLSCGSFGLHQGYVPSYPASHGCIRVPAGNAKSMFLLAELGDEVVIQR